MKAPVSATVALLSRDLKGRVRHGVLLDTVLRGAVLVDLALEGRLSEEDEQISIDDTPTGYAPADEQARAMVAEPGRRLHGWLVRDEPAQPRLIDYWLTENRWQQTHHRRRVARYEDRLESQVMPLRWRLRHIVNDDAVANAAETCAAVLAQLAGLLDQDANAVEADLLERCADAAWLMPLINDWAADRIALQRDLAAAAPAGSVGGTPGA